jgi:hypothetical protein
VGLDLKKIVCSHSVVLIHASVDANIYVLGGLPVADLVIAEESVSLSMLESDHISRVEHLVHHAWLQLAVVDDLPFVEVRGAVGLKLLENLFRILSTYWTLRSVNGGLSIVFDLVLNELLRHMYVAIIFLVVEDNVVVEHHRLSVLAILVALLDEESNPLCRWVLRELQLLAFSIDHGGLLGILQVHLGVHVF